MSDPIWSKYLNPLTELNAYMLELAVLLGGHGDHLEIGTLFGASAIHAALTKKRNGLGGKVVCIDPFESDLLTPTIWAQCNDIAPTVEIVMSNATHFGVDDRIEIIQKKSNPLPFAGQRFATAYIDGDHSVEGVRADWNNLKKIVDVAVLLDDDKTHMGTYKVAREDIAVDKDWKAWFAYQMVLVLRLNATLS